MTADRDTETAPERANEMAAKSAALAYRGKMIRKRERQKTKAAGVEANAQAAASAAPQTRRRPRPRSRLKRRPGARGPGRGAAFRRALRGLAVRNGARVGARTPPSQGQGGRTPLTGEFDTRPRIWPSWSIKAARVMAAAMSAPDPAETRSELAANVADATKTLAPSPNTG